MMKIALILPIIAAVCFFVLCFCLLCRQVNDTWDQCERWFLLYWLSVGGAVLMLLLSGCELPREGRNYNPTTPYQWVP